MSYIYNADVWCDSCGLAIQERIIDEGNAPDEPEDEASYDSDDFPKYAPSEEEADSPTHCAARDDCFEALDLRDWGLSAFHDLKGAETLQIGALIYENLTPEGVAYLKEMLADDVDLTPYQKALHRFWRAAFADYL